jgi:SpoVK/Ycf46/Vps4 family AAA+-type ATPase
MSDISLDVTKVEKILDKLFHMAESWGAILLFDEADILMAHRTSSVLAEELTRNSIVGGR